MFWVGKGHFESPNMYHLFLFDSSSIRNVIINGSFADQWSPLNLEGKKLYDREFLLQLQFSSKSTAKPAGLPDLPDIIIDTVCKSEISVACIEKLNIHQFIL